MEKIVTGLGAKYSYVTLRPGEAAVGKIQDLQSGYLALNPDSSL